MSHVTTSPMFDVTDSDSDIIVLCDRTHLFSSDLRYHIYTISLIPLSFGPYSSQIFHCLVLHIIFYHHISFYYIPCPHPSSPHQVIAFTLKNMYLCFFFSPHTEIIIIFPFHSFRTSYRKIPSSDHYLTLAPILPFAYFTFFC